MGEWVARRRRARSVEEADDPAQREPSPRDQLLAWQRAAGNQAVARLLQRAKVESWELEMRAAGDDTTKLGGGVVVHMRRSAQEAFVPVNDSTSSDYLDRAEAALGSLEPLNILAKWEILPRAHLPKPWWRSHLIGAEFGGQKKYAPAENVRYHPETLEQGEWQACESAVKQQKRGTLYATSNECRGAAALAKEVAAALNIPAPPLLLSSLEQTLRAADNVADTVGFEFVATEGKSVPGQWTAQNALLKLKDGVTPQKVYSALAEMQAKGLLAKEAITINDTDREPAAAKITTFDALRDYLAAPFAQAGEGRKKAVRAKFRGLLNVAAVGDDQFSEQVWKLPEIQHLSSKPKLQDVKTWLTAQNVDTVL